MQAAPSDIRRHQQMWNGFCKFLMISTVGVVLLLILMAIFLL